MAGADIEFLRIGIESQLNLLKEEVPKLVAETGDSKMSWTARPRPLDPSDV